LPVHSNPATLIEFYQCRNSATAVTQHPTFKDAYSNAFNSLTFQGDRYLASISGPIITEFFGVENKTLINVIIGDWVSNKTWMLLAVSYRLDRYVGWVTQTYLDLLKTGTNISLTLRALPKNRQENGDKKYWADIWEAWWAGIMLERELWNEDFEDIKSILRRLIFLKYQKIIQYSTRILAFKSQNTASKILKNEIKVTTILRSNEMIEECLGPSTEQTKPFGYFAEVASPHETKRDIAVYAVAKDDAIKKAMEFARSGRSSSIPLFYVLTVASPRPLPSFLAKCNERDEDSIRQLIFDAMARHWFGKPIPLEQTAIINVYMEVQTLGNNLINNSPNATIAFKTHTKQFAILFYYEVRI
jgi:dsRNA-specific ribonuclease